MGQGLVGVLFYILEIPSKQMKKYVLEKLLFGKVEGENLCSEEDFFTKYLSYSMKQKMNIKYR